MRAGPFGILDLGPHSGQVGCEALELSILSNSFAIEHSSSGTVILMTLYLIQDRTIP
jgi:hypothetical protein